MTIALNLTDQEAEAIIEACKVLKDNPVLWLLSDRLESLLDMERDKQAESARVAACNHALATAKLGTLRDRGKILYRALLDSSNV